MKQIKNTKNNIEVDGKFVLENNLGQVVRVLDWPNNTSLNVIYRHDTRRIETTDDLEFLELENIDYTLIENLKKSDVQKKPVKIGSVGKLRYMADIKTHSP